MEYSASLSYEERFRLTGTLRPEDISELLDSKLSAESIEDAAVYIDEIVLPNEDVMDDVIFDVRSLLANVRGANQVAVSDILKQLEFIKESVFIAADDNADLIRKALRILDASK